MTAKEKILTDKDLYIKALGYANTLHGLQSQKLFWRLFDEYRSKVEVDDPADFIEGVIQLHQSIMKEEERLSFSSFSLLADLVSKWLNIPREQQETSKEQQSEQTEQLKRGPSDIE